MCSLLGFSFQNPYFNQKATAFPHLFLHLKLLFRSPSLRILRLQRGRDYSSTGERRALFFPDPEP